MEKEKLKKKGHVFGRNLDKTEKKAEYYAEEVDPDLLAWCDALNITLNEYYTMPDREMMLRIKHLDGRLRLKVASNLIALQKEKLNFKNKIHFVIEKKDQGTDVQDFIRQPAGEEKLNKNIKNGKRQSSKRSIKAFEDEIPGSSNEPMKKHRTLSNQSLRPLLPDWLQKSSNKSNGQVPSKENVHTLLPKMLKKVRQDNKSYHNEVDNSKRNKSNIKKLLCRTATDLERLYGGGNDNCGNVFLEAMDSRNFDDDECSEEESDDENGSWIGGWRRSFIELVDPQIPHDTSFDNDPNPPPIAPDFNPAPQLCSTPKLGPRHRRPMLRNFSDYEFHLSGIGDYSSADDMEQNMSIAEDGLGAEVAHVSSRSRIIVPRRQNPERTYNVGKTNTSYNTSSGNENATFATGRGNGTVTPRKENATYFSGRGNATFNAGKENATYNAGKKSGACSVGKEYASFKPGRGNSTLYTDMLNSTFNMKQQNASFMPNATYAIEKENSKARGNATCSVRKGAPTCSQNEACNRTGPAKSTYILNANRSDTALNVSEFRNTSIDLPLASSTMRNSRSQRNSCCTTPGRSINISVGPGNRTCSRNQESRCKDATFNVNDNSPCRDGNESRNAAFVVNRKVNQIIIKLV